jgi:hypothetical protein
MGKNKKKKLALKKETVRKLDALNEAELKQAAGAGDYYNLNHNFTIGNLMTLVCYRPTTTYTCGCNPSGEYC